MNAGVSHDAVRRRRARRGGARPSVRASSVNGERTADTSTRFNPSIIGTSNREEASRRRDLRRPSGEHEVSVASAASIFKHLDPRALRAGRRSGSRRTAAGRCLTGRRRDLGGGRHRSSASQRAGPRAGSASRRASRRRHAAHDRPARRAERVGRDRPRPRRRLPGAARPVRRGRHGAGPARAGQRAVRRRRRARLRGRHGQGGDEDALRRAAACRSCDYDGRAAARLAARRARRHARASSTELGFPVFVKPANLGSSVGISKAKHATRAARRRWSWRSSSTARSSSRRRCRNAREIECAVLGNDDPEASVPGEIVPVARVLRLRSEVLDDGSTHADSRADSPSAQADEVRRAGDRGVPGGRRRRHGARRLPARRATPACSPQRGEHHPRLHDDQHVPEDVGSRAACPYPALARSPDRARARAPRREAAAAHQHVRRGGDRRPLVDRGGWLPASCRHRLAAAGLTEAPRLAAVYDAILDAASIASTAQLQQACPPAPAEACTVAARSSSLWWQILLDPESRRSIGGSTTRRPKPSQRRRAWTQREPQRAEAWFYLGGAYAPRVQWRVLRGERLAAARDGKRSRTRSSGRCARSRSTTPTSASACITTTPTSRRPRRSAALAAAAARRRPCEGTAGDAAGARAGPAAARRGRLPAAPIYLWYEKQPRDALELLDALDARYPRIRSSSQRIAEVQRDVSARPSTRAPRVADAPRSRARNRVASPARDRSARANASCAISIERGDRDET